MKRRIWEQKGFTLLELSIVLVIIGIILAAVIKGQDLLASAKAKQFTANLQSWQIAVNNFMDFKKALPGDPCNSGFVGGNTIVPVCTAATTANSINGDAAPANVSTDMSVLSSPPVKLFTLGVNTYYVFLGNDGNTSPKNIILVCTNSDCTGTFNPEALKMASSFAGTIDNIDDVEGPYDQQVSPPSGYQNFRVYGITGGVGTPSTTRGLVTLVSGGTKVTSATNVDWLTQTGITGLVYLFQ